MGDCDALFVGVGRDVLILDSASELVNPCQPNTCSGSLLNTTRPVTETPPPVTPPVELFLESSTTPTSQFSIVLSGKGSNTMIALILLFSVFALVILLIICSVIRAKAKRGAKQKRSRRKRRKRERRRKSHPNGLCCPKFWSNSFCFHLRILDGTILLRLPPASWHRCEGT